MNVRLFYICTAFVGLLLLLLHGIAYAERSDWVKTIGGRVRLVVNTPVQSSQEIRGVIQIELEDGWKTYWREPGNAGIPPQINLTDSTNVITSQIAFPAPQRFGEGQDQLVGYKQSVMFPVIFQLDHNGKPVPLKGYVFLGICKTICIPVQAEFDLLIQNDKPDALARTLISTAFDRLPQPATTDFSIRKVERQDGLALFEAKLEDTEQPTELFLSSQDMMFTVPKIEWRKGKNALFSSTILSGGDKYSIAIDYTLIQGNRAVSGTINLH